jgi:hypothetical protein
MLMAVGIGHGAIAGAAIVTFLSIVVPGRQASDQPRHPADRYRPAP